MLKFSLSPDILIYTQILCRHVGKMINSKNILNNLVFHTYNRIFAPKSVKL